LVVFAADADTFSATTPALLDDLRLELRG